MIGKEPVGRRKALVRESSTLGRSGRRTYDGRIKERCSVMEDIVEVDLSVGLATPCPDSFTLSLLKKE